MSHSMPPLVRPALVFFIALSALTGVLYPLAVTGLGQALFPDQANGSLLLREGRPVGSRLIGQSFSDPAHFWGRPSATGPMAYNAGASSGSNQGPLNPALTEAVKARIAALREADPDQKAPVPVDLVTASASGLDPHGLGVPEVYWMRRSADYRAAAAGFAAGTEQGLTDWLVLSCRALQEGAREAIAIADLKK